jgi:hypothetical protein
MRRASGVETWTEPPQRQRGPSPPQSWRLGLRRWTGVPSKTPATPGSPVRPAPSGTQKEQVAVRDFCSRFRTGSRRDVDTRRAPCLRSAS